VTINDRGLDQATRSLGRLSSEVSRLKASDSQRLQNEYQNLVNGLIDQGLLDAPANDAALGSVSYNLFVLLLVLKIPDTLIYSCFLSLLLLRLERPES